MCYHWYDILSLIFTQFNYIHTEPWFSCCKEIATANLFQSFSSEICKNNRWAHHWKVCSLTTKVTSVGLRDKELAPSISSCRKQSFYMEKQKYRKWSLCIIEKDGTFQKDNSVLTHPKSYFAITISNNHHIIQNYLTNFRSYAGKSWTKLPFSVAGLQLIFLWQLDFLETNNSVHLLCTKFSTSLKDCFTLVAKTIQKQMKHQ